MEFHWNVNNSVTNEVFIKLLKINDFECIENKKVKLKVPTALW